MEWVLIIVGIALLAVPVALVARRPKEHPTANWIGVDADVTAHEGPYPVVRYDNPGGRGIVETPDGLRASAEDLPVGTRTLVLVDPLNPVHPFVADRWRAAEKRRAIISAVTGGLGLVAIIVGVVLLATA